MAKGIPRRKAGPCMDLTQCDVRHAATAIVIDTMLIVHIACARIRMHMSRQHQVDLVGIEELFKLVAQVLCSPLQIFSDQSARWQLARAHKLTRWHVNASIA